MNQSSATIVATLKSILANDLDLNLDIEAIDEKAPMLEDGMNLDSVVIVELIALVEERFGFEFADEDLRTASFASLESLAQVIEKSL